MRQQAIKVPVFNSLRMQLLIGAALLLAITVAGVGYALSLNQRRSLTQTMIQTVALQGRNVALSGEKSILRPDPEFELCPLVTRIMTEVPDIQALVVVDRDGAVQGHVDPSQVGKPFAPLTRDGTSVVSPIVRPDETLRDSGGSYILATPVLSGASSVGTVYLTYSKQALLSEQRRALLLTVRLSAVALLAGLLLAVLFFSRISRPMDTLMKGLDAFARDLSFSIVMPTHNEFRVLADSFNRMARQIQEAQRDLLAKERLAHEIDLARQIQESLVPRSVADAASFEIGYHYESAYEVGGDYLDIIPVDRSHVFFVMADVSGKGVPGMVVMAMTRALVRQFAASGATPREVLIRLNQALAGNLRRNMFVTAFVGVLDIDKREFTYSNAGHNPLVVYGSVPKSAKGMRLQGAPLGIFETGRFADTVMNYSTKLTTGDVVLIYTDGLIESVNAAKTQFTLDRVIGLAADHATLGAKHLVKKLVAEERRFRGDAAQADDITLLAFGVAAETTDAVRRSS